MIMPNETVEFVVFLFLDLVLAASPKRLNGVQMLAVELDVERYKTRVPLHDILKAVGFRKLPGFVLELQRNFGPARQIPHWSNLIPTRAFTRPLPALFLRKIRSAVDRDALGRHEARIESNTELTNQFGVRLLVFRQLLQKRLGARMRDRAQIFHQFTMGHADPSVGKCDGTRRFIGRQSDRRSQFGLKNGNTRGLGETKFFTGIRSIRYELPDKDFLIGVEGVNDNIQQLLDLEFLLR